MSKNNEISTSQIYETFSNLVMHSEIVRWNRFYNLLLVNSILMASWAVIFSKTNNIPNKIILIIICIPGIILSILWSFLGKRSSKNLDDFHHKAEQLENLYISDVYLPKPYHISEETRKKASSGLEKFTTSTWIVIWVPIIFSIIFLILIIISLSC